MAELDEVAKGVESAEQEQQKSSSEQGEAKPEKTEEPEKDAKPEAEAASGQETENKAAEGGEEKKEAEKEEEPEVKEKPQQSDPEEPDDGVPIVLVTGASGYVATHIIKQLLEQARFRVRGTVRSLDNEKKVKPLRELVAEPKYPLRLIEADLLNPKNWTEAVSRCSYVFHVASPFPSKAPKNPDVIIKPAVEGTTNVLKACAESGTVKRVILTSSVAAVSCGIIGNPGKPQDYVYTEADWSDEKTCPTYERSKLKAEQAAVEFVKNLPEGGQIELVALCPGFVQGPLLSPSSGDTSISFCCNLLKHGMSRIPDVHMAVIDVRDAAAAHIAALEKPEAAGNRYLLVGNETVPLKQFAQILDTEFKPQGYKVPKKNLPKAQVWVAKIFNSEAKVMYPMIGKHNTWSNERMKGELGIQPRPVEETLIDMAYSVIELGLVEKKKDYLGHPSTRPPPPEPTEEPEAQAQASATETQQKDETPAEASKSEEPSSQPAKEEPPPSEPAKQESQGEPTKEEAQAEQPKEEPQAEQPKEEPQAEQPKEEPPTEQPKEEPPTEQSKEEPEQPKEEPPTEPAQEQPSTEPQQEEPQTEPASEEPAKEEPSSEPAPQEEASPSGEADKEESPSEPAKDEDQPSTVAETEEPPPETEEPPPGEQAKEEQTEEQTESSAPADTDPSSEEAKDETSEPPQQQDQEPDQSEGT